MLTLSLTYIFSQAMRIMNHAAFEIYYHITFQVKYRHKCITLDMLTRMESIFRDTLTKWRSNLVSFSGESDYVHLVIETHPSLNLSQLIANLKTVSSRYIRKEYAEHLSKYFWKPYFWSKSYGVKSISRGADLNKIIEYVQNQEKPAQ